MANQDDGCRRVGEGAVGPSLDQFGEGGEDGDFEGQLGIKAG